MSKYDCWIFALDFYFGNVFEVCGVEHPSQKHSPLVLSVEDQTLFEPEVTGHPQTLATFSLGSPVFLSGVGKVIQCSSQGSSAQPEGYALQLGVE